MVGATLALTVIVMVLALVPSAGGVTGFGLAPQLTPAGWPVQESDTLLLKPFAEVTVHELVPLVPAATLSDAGLQLTLKSGDGGGGGGPLLP